MSQNWYSCALRTATALLLAVVLVAVSFGAGWAAFDRVFLALGTAKPVGPYEYDQSEGAGDEIDMSLLWQATRLLREHYYGGNVPEGKDLTYAAVRGLINELEDPFTAFVDPQHAELLREDMQGEFEGIGATVRMTEDGELMIVSPITGSPAEEAGLRSGDIILSADGQPLKDMTVLEAVSIIRGPRGTTVTLRVLREGDDTFTVDITRDRIQIPTVETRVIEEQGQKVGYLKLNDFNARATRQVREALRELGQEDVAGLVLDLRNNPGGYLRTSIEVTSQFIEEDKVVVIERGQDTEEVHRADGGGAWLDKPLVILINQGSASASEIVAGALQDYDRGTLVGTTTFGKGSVQAPHTLSDNSSLRVTIARWFTPNDRAIHETGIEPDLVVELTPADERAGRDPQLETALDTLVSEIEARR